MIEQQFTCTQSSERWPVPSSSWGGVFLCSFCPLPVKNRNTEEGYTPHTLYASSSTTALRLSRMLRNVLVSLLFRRAVSIATAAAAPITNNNKNKNTPVISVHDITTLRFVDVNDAALAFGQSKETMLSKTLFQLVETQDHDAVRHAIAQLKASSSLSC